MVHVAKEMQREGFHLPLLIGGATTSSKHTAVKIAPAFEQPVVHVIDASRTVPVVDKLLRADTRAEFDKLNRAHQEQEREAFAKKQARKLVSYQAAQDKKLKLDWQNMIRPNRHSWVSEKSTM